MDDKKLEARVDDLNIQILPRMSARIFVSPGQGKSSSCDLHSATPPELLSTYLPLASMADSRFGRYIISWDYYHVCRGKLLDMS